MALNRLCAPQPTPAERGTAPRRVRAASWTALALVALSALAMVGCHQTSCGGPAGCPSGSVCQLDGRCAPLGRGPDLRLARVQRLTAVDWGMTRADRPSTPGRDSDRLALGGDVDATVYLAFGPLPADVARAVLTLRPHPEARGAPARARLAVRRTGPFDGRRLTRRGAPAAGGAAAILRGFRAAAAHPMRFDVTDAATAASQGRARLHLAIRAAGPWKGAPWPVASPRASDPELRPHLDLVLR